MIIRLKLDFSLATLILKVVKKLGNLILNYLI